MTIPQTRPSTPFPAVRRSPWHVTRSNLSRLGLAVLAIAGATAIRVAIGGPLGSESPFVTLYPAVAVAAWAGGLVGGLAATALAIPVATFLFVPGPDAFHLADAVRIALFAAGAAIISALGGDLHAARARAEAARARADFLAGASTILAASLDALTTVEALARIAVPGFADWCAIDLLDDSGVFGTSRVAHADPDKVAYGYRRRREQPLTLDDRHGPGAVVRSGQAEFVPDVPVDYAEHSSDLGYAETVRSISIRSYLCVPLAVRGRILGTLSAAMSESGRRFVEEDLAIAADLAARAAVALDHARLYRRSAARAIELDRIIGAMDDGVLLADENGTVRSQNRAALRILGERPADLDAALAALVAQPESPIGPDLHRVAATGRFVRVTTFEAEAEGERSRILVLRDVTEILESKLAHDTFVGMLSHEVRTPITTIYGTAQVLLRHVDETVRTDLVRDLASETERLYRLVEDLLVLTRHERGSLEIAPEPVLLQRLLPRVAAAEQTHWPGLTVLLDVEPDLPPVVADPTYVEQVVRNLVGNGAKYGGLDSPLRLRARSEEGDVLVEVEDAGPGVPEAETERIFELYERLDHSHRAGIPGAGIGLFVCRRLVELMGGRIGVRRGPSGGAVFSFSLPRYADQASFEDGAAGPASPEALAQRPIGRVADDAAAGDALSVAGAVTTGVVSPSPGSVPARQRPSVGAASAPGAFEDGDVARQTGLAGG